MQRDWRPKISLVDRKGPRKPKEGNDTGENTHRNGLARVVAGICGFVGLAWWRMQSSETGLHLKNREFFENFGPKQAFEWS
jgi:hypothetical protein